MYRSDKNLFSQYRNLLNRALCAFDHKTDSGTYIKLKTSPDPKPVRDAKNNYSTIEISKTLYSFGSETDSGTYLKKLHKSGSGAGPCRKKVFLTIKKVPVPV
jgi:hypothetical protein